MARETRPGSQFKGLEVEGLAEYVLATLAARSSDRQRPRSSSEVKNLCNALTTPDDANYQQLFLNTIADGGTSDDLIDRMIPDLARQLGEEWSTDKLSFAEVAVGASRLQQTVRRHGARKEIDGLKSPIGQRVLLAVPEHEQHSLGALIVANQMRRLGILVHLALDCTLDQIRALVEGQNYLMVGLSLGSVHSLDQAHKFACSAREAGTNAPIVLGGVALAEHSNDLASQFEADFLAKDVREALDFCQIDTARPAALPLECVEP